jgi:restriction system protein
MLKVENKQVLPLNLGSLQFGSPVPQWSTFEPPKPFFLFAWMAQQRKQYAQRLVLANESFKSAKATHAKSEAERRRAIDRLTQEHEQALATAASELARRNATIDKWKEAFGIGEPEAVEEYCQTILSKSPYSANFPQEAKIVFIKGSQQLVVEYSLPAFDQVIPKQKGFTYVKANDSVKEISRPEKERRALYASVVAQCILRSIHELYGADTDGLIETIVFNGHVDTFDPSTGLAKRPCIVSVRVTRDQFLEINLCMADPVAALQKFKATFSKSPAELSPVRPLLEFDMVDRRFIAESDVLSSLEQRPNLMDLSASEFESLITNLFQQMGLEAKLTQASRDGGVDCVAFDPRPIFGGKVVIQAKRYKNTVGVSAVRDLYGTMMNEGASKGILVTTSGYGKASHEFASGKPIELLDGSNLLYLLIEHAGVNARIVMPDE